MLNIQAIIVFVLVNPNWFILTAMNADLLDVNGATDEMLGMFESRRRQIHNRMRRKGKHWSSAVDSNGDMISHSAEHALYRTLLGSHYLRHVRPVRKHRNPIVVKVGMCVMMIEDLVERDQIMVMASCVKMAWKDDFLSWDPSLFDNVTWMALSSDKIWLPDLAIVNSPEPLGLTRKKTNLDVNYKGEVGYFPSGRLATRCNLVITFFPFDWQHCEVRFESWIYPTKYLEIELYPGDEGVDLKEYYVNYQWSIIGFTVRTEIVDYDGKNFSSITFIYSLRRKPTFYFMYFIFPELLLALLQTLSHTLPVEHPGRMTMLTALFIGTTVTHAGIAAHIPKSSDTMSLLQIYMSIMSLNLVLALIITFAMLYTVLRYPNEEPSFRAMMAALFSIVWPEKLPKKKYLRAGTSKQSKQSKLKWDNPSITSNKRRLSFNRRKKEISSSLPLRPPLTRNISELYLNRDSSNDWEKVSLRRKPRLSDRRVSTYSEMIDNNFQPRSMARGPSLHTHSIYGSPCYNHTKMLHPVRVFDEQYKSIAHCLSPRSPTSPELFSSRRGPMVPRFSMDQLSSVNSIERRMSKPEEQYNVSIRNRRPSSLYGSHDREQSIFKHQDNENMWQTHSYQRGPNEDYELKRRWLMYCVALDKSIMYANLIWNIAIPITLFLIVPVVNEVSMSSVTG